MSYSLVIFFSFYFFIGLVLSEEKDYACELSVQYYPANFTSVGEPIDFSTTLDDGYFLSTSVKKESSLTESLLFKLSYFGDIESVFNVTLSRLSYPNYLSLPRIVSLENDEIFVISTDCSCSGTVLYKGCFFMEKYSLREKKMVWGKRIEGAVHNTLGFFRVISMNVVAGQYLDLLMNDPDEHVGKHNIDGYYLWLRIDLNSGEVVINRNGGPVVKENFGGIHTLYDNVIFGGINMVQEIMKIGSHQYVKLFANGTDAWAKYLKKGDYPTTNKPVSVLSSSIDDGAIVALIDDSSNLFEYPIFRLNKDGDVVWSRKITFPEDISTSRFFITQVLQYVRISTASSLSFGVSEIVLDFATGKLVSSTLRRFDTSSFQNSFFQLNTRDLYTSAMIGLDNERLFFDVQNPKGESCSSSSSLEDYNVSVSVDQLGFTTSDYYHISAPMKLNVTIKSKSHLIDVKNLTSVVFKKEEVCKKCYKIHFHPIHPVHPKNKGDTAKFMNLPVVVGIVVLASCILVMLLVVVLVVCGCCVCGCCICIVIAGSSQKSKSLNLQYEAI